jgi:hypothetical protein
MQYRKIVEGLLFNKSRATREAFLELNVGCPDPQHKINVLGCCYQEIFFGDIVPRLNQFEIADVIRASCIAYTEYADYLCEEVLIESCRFHSRAGDQYQQREVTEGFLLGLLESVVIMQENHEQQGMNEQKHFQRVWPTVAYRLLFEDCTNWEIRDKKMAGRFASAIGEIGKGFNYQREVRHKQLVAWVRAAQLSTKRFRSGWHNEIAKKFAFTLFGFEGVRDELSMLVEHHKDLTDSQEFDIPKNLLAK